MRNGDLYISIVVIGIVIMFAAGLMASPGSKMSLRYPESKHIWPPDAQYKCTNSSCPWSGDITEMKYKKIDNGIVELYCPECGTYLGWTYYNEFYNL